MVQKGKINVKERFSDGEIDLSMSDLDEVPVKEIAALKKTTSLDLSNNRLTLLPSNFTILINLTKLDLSKNELTELPEDFGNLSKLKYLDLYKNNLERLPLSFGQLSSIKFLDLKDNPLIPAIAKVAGPCVDTKGCQQCARDVVNFYRRLQQEVDNEVEMRKKARQKQLEINQQKKQEDKKKLKKEKQNNKPKKDAEKNDHKNSTNVTKKHSRKEEKWKSTQKKEHRTANLLLYKVLGLLVLFSASFLLFHSLLAETLNDFSKYIFDWLLEKLPDGWATYVISFVNILGSYWANLNNGISYVLYDVIYIDKFLLTVEPMIQSAVRMLTEGKDLVKNVLIGKGE